MLRPRSVGIQSGCEAIRQLPMSALPCNTSVVPKCHGNNHDEQCADSSGTPADLDVNADFLHTNECKTHKQCATGRSHSRLHKYRHFRLPNDMPTPKGTEHNMLQLNT